MLTPERLRGSKYTSLQPHIKPASGGAATSVCDGLFGSTTR